MGKLATLVSAVACGAVYPVMFTWLDPFWGVVLLLLYACTLALLQAPWSHVKGPLAFLLGFVVGGTGFYLWLRRGCRAGCGGTSLRDFGGLDIIALILAGAIESFFWWAQRRSESTDS